MKYRPGDVFLVRAKVVEKRWSDSDGSVLCAELSPNNAQPLHGLDVASVESTSIQVGDAVRRTSPSGPLTGVVLALHDDALWVQIATGQLQTWRTSECERVD